MKRSNSHLLATTLALTTLAASPAMVRAQDRETLLPSALPVRSVTLFSSGVGYIERGGDVRGDAAVRLLFRTGQINDILKSLILIDEKGQVQPAVYGAKDPLGRTLRSFAVDVTENLSQSEALRRLRGARVTVRTGRRTVTGRIVGVEERAEKVGDTTVAVPYITVLADDKSLTTLRLDSGASVQLLDARLQQEFADALGVLATGADNDRRPVTLHFSGDGTRRVRVGYVTEMPLWKMTYRLVLDDNKESTVGASGYLQGWALVENTTDDDWNDIRLSLVSGRPVSFIQDLYQPLYLPRPVVPPDVIASPYPQLSEGSLDARDKAVVNAPPLAAAPGSLALGEEMAKSVARRGAVGGGGFGGGITAFDADMAAASVQAQASGAQSGELFQYNITTPVSLPRQQAAMIPVVTQNVTSEKVSVYNRNVDARFPRNAVRLTNNTNLHLKGGPITLFDGGTYAGDARMEDVPPGDSRLISYAVDLGLEVNPEDKGGATTETSFVIRRGVFEINRREEQQTEYTLKNRTDSAARRVIVEHPYDTAFNLVAPKEPLERTANFYRFAVNVAPGQSEKLTVVTERPISQSIGLVDGDLNFLAVYANRTTIRAEIRAALVEVLRRRAALQDLQGQIAAHNTEIKTIGEDQDRIRKNMNALDKTSALYKRYVAQLDQQETRLEKLRAEIERLNTQAAAADRDLREYVDNLNVGRGN